MRNKKHYSFSTEQLTTAQRLFIHDLTVRKDADSRYTLDCELLSDPLVLPEKPSKGRFGADRESSPDADVRRTPNTSPNTSPDTQTVTTDTQPVAKKTDAENEAALALFDLVSSVRAPTRKASPLYYPSQQTATWSAVPRQASRTGGSQTWPILELFGRHWITWQHACKLTDLTRQYLNYRIINQHDQVEVLRLTSQDAVNLCDWLRTSAFAVYNMQKSENKCIFFDYYHVLNLERVRTGNKYTTQQRHSGEPKTLAYRNKEDARASQRARSQSTSLQRSVRDGSDSEFEAPRRTRMYKPPSKRRGGRVVSAQHDGSDDSDTLSLSQSDEEETQFQYRRRKITKSLKNEEDEDDDCGGEVMHYMSDETASHEDAEEERDSIGDIVEHNDVSGRAVQKASRKRAADSNSSSPDLKLARTVATQAASAAEKAAVAALTAAKAAAAARDRIAKRSASQEVTTSTLSTFRKPVTRDSAPDRSLSPLSTPTTTTPAPTIAATTTASAFTSSVQNMSAPNTVVPPSAPIAQNTMMGYMPIASMPTALVIVDNRMVVPKAEVEPLRTPPPRMEMPVWMHYSAFQPHRNAMSASGTPTDKGPLSSSMC